MQRVFFLLSAWLCAVPAWAQFDPPSSIGKDTTSQDIQALYKGLIETTTVRRTDEKDTILLAFERGDDRYEEAAYYVFTKPGHYAHPAVLFRDTRIEYAARKVDIKTSGATADLAKSRDFAGWQTAFNRMNDELLTMRSQQDKVLREKIQRAVARGVNDPK